MLTVLLLVCYLCDGFVCYLFMGWLIIGAKVGLLSVPGLLFIVAMGKFVILAWVGLLSEPWVSLLSVSWDGLLNVPWFICYLCRG